MRQLEIWRVDISSFSNCMDHIVLSFTLNFPEYNFIEPVHRASLI